MSGRRFDVIWRDEVMKKDKTSLVDMLERVMRDKEKLFLRNSDHAFVRVLTSLRKRGLITEEAALAGIATLEAGL